MKLPGPWATEHFDQLSWHDVHVHGFAMAAFNAQNGTCDLLLDIDYILRWDKKDNGYSFRVCRAELRFESVFGLKLELDYSSASAGMCPFSLSGIERELVSYPTGHSSYKWRLPVNWPPGLISFESPGFKQRLVGQPQEQSNQWLGPESRANSCDA
jgi:hypothetical protein